MATEIKYCGSVIASPRAGQIVTLKCGGTKMTSDVVVQVKGGGGVSDDRVHYVTFMYGDTELYRMPVVNGDTCHDPVAKGYIETPTKESTAQYDYPYSGWSLTEGGTADTTNALANVTEDRTVYAAFTSTVRKYTITYYDSDGVTVVHAETLAYGATSPSSYPSKEGFYASGFIPEFSTVDCDASYIVVWAEKANFATASWKDISTICENGEASLHFAVGDTRIELVDGQDCTLEIIGINHDTKSDGTGKAGITIWCKKHTYTCTKNVAGYYPWTSNLHPKEEALFDLFSPELQAAIKSVNKDYCSASGPWAEKQTGSARLWSLSAYEINCTACHIYEGSVYEKFKGSSKTTISTSTTYDDIKTGYGYWLRSPNTNGYPLYVSGSGYIYYQSSGTAENFILPCFCV